MASLGSLVVQLAVDTARFQGDLGRAAPIAESQMERLYVKPAYRGKRLGRELALAIIEEAKRLGYKPMRLDTVVAMKEASALYRTLGFQTIDAYCYNPLPDAMYFELELA